MRKRSKLGRIINNNRRLFIDLAVALVVFAYLIIRMLPVRTTFVREEVHNFTEPVKAYVFKNEEYALVNSTSKVNLLVEEGTKISASTLLSDNYTITTGTYLDEKIQAIDFMLANQGADSNALYRMVYEKEQVQADIQKKLDSAVEAKDSELSKTLADELEVVQHEIFIIKKAVQYVFTSADELSALRASYEAQKGSSMPLTAENLNFSIFGYMSYSIDGYENTMNFAELNLVSSEYLNSLDKLSPAVSTSNDSYVLKSTSCDRLVLVLRLDSDSFVYAQEACEKIYNSIIDEYDMSDEGGYFNFIFRRVDLLNIFPSFNLTTADSEIFSGELIKVDNTDDEKLLYVALRKGILDLQERRIFVADAQTESYNCYVLKASCVYEQNGKSYVSLVNNSTNKTAVEVKVFCIDDGYAYLKVSENENISEGSEVKLGGK